MAGTNRRKKTNGNPARPREGAEFLSDVVGKNVASARVFAALTQDDLAERMRAFGHGWHGTTTGQVERGLRVVTVEELLALALALGVTVYYLLTLSHQDEIELVDIGPDSVIPTLRRSEVDKLYRARGRSLPPPPLVIWEGNKPSAWALAENEIRLGDLIGAMEDDLGTAAVIDILGKWDSEAVHAGIVRFEEGEMLIQGSLAGQLQGMEVLEAIKKLYAARDPEVEPDS